MKYLGILILLQSCAMQAGFSIHSIENDVPEVTLENPLFKFHGTIKTKNGAWFIDHTSGVFVREEGYGLTEAGYLWNLSH